MACLWKRLHASFADALPADQIKSIRKPQTTLTFLNSDSAQALIVIAWHDRRCTRLLLAPSPRSLNACPPGIRMAGGCESPSPQTSIAWSRAYGLLVWTRIFGGISQCIWIMARCPGLDQWTVSTHSWTRSTSEDDGSDSTCVHGRASR